MTLSSSDGSREIPHFFALYRLRMLIVTCV
uniref:Uncharacterized protein n=1 Tax=Rhizophora mucronata TaxID=61149 RepID=A0A2P2JW49_RHIMU